MAEVTGRYLYLQVQSVEYRVYFEEAGTGVPVVLQHTAGCDSRQWRHVLEDPDLTSRYRLIAPDLPFHGRSLPPESQEWWTEEYRLHQDFFLAFHVALVQALELEAPRVRRLLDGRAPRPPTSPCTIPACTGP